MKATTTGEVVAHLLGGTSLREAAASPPDVFCVAAALSELSGAYLNITDRHFVLHPLGIEAGNWEEHARKVGEAWRRAVVGLGNETSLEISAEKMPPEVIRDLGELEGASSKALPDLARSHSGAILRLIAYADEACAGVGLPVEEKDERAPFVYQMQLRLLAGLDGEDGTSLCRHVHPRKGAVLPKMRVPQVGLTLRSLSHHLAFIPGSHVVTRWMSPFTDFPANVKGSLNLVVLPWPLHVSPRQFEVEPGLGASKNPGQPGYFVLKRPSFSGHLDTPSSDGSMASTEEGSRRADWARHIQHAVQSARSQLGSVHGLIMPEASLSPAEFDALTDLLLEEDAGSGLGDVLFLVCGVHGVESGPNVVNQVRYWFRDPLPMGIPKASASPLKPIQGKHHRWKLDPQQVLQYGLGSSLALDKSWWESHLIPSRQLYFVALADWLSFCTVICEDLARQDPVAQVIRSVGPNLVIALLADGPQIETRWSARYASVLADDPGASVLTVTSLGLAEASRPRFQKTTKSRVVGLWRDSASGQAFELELPPGANGLALTLCRDFQREWSCDGRSDGGMASHLRLASCTPLPQESHP